MSYFVTGNVFTHYVNVVSATPVDVTPNVLGKAVLIASIEVTEISGGTPNMTIDIFDPNGATATYYKRNALAMTVRQNVVYPEPFWLPNGWQLRVTTSAGTVSVLVNYFDPNAASRR